jgi:heme exporter protein D
MGEKPAGETALSVPEFFAMGGYAFYVWTAYGVTLMVLLYNYLSPVLQRKKLLRQLSIKQKRERK